MPNTTTLQIDHGARAHAKHSPSSLKHKEVCPGWESENKSSVHTDMGERMHEASELYLAGDMSLFNALPEAEQYFVQQNMDYIEPLLVGADEIIPERRLVSTDPVLGEFAHGTPDLVILYGGDKAHLVDHKFGLRRVDSPEFNLQAYAYIVALFDTYLTLNEVTFHFLAPRITDGFTSFTFNRAEDYERLLTRVKRTIERCEDPASKRNPCWSACAYCANKAGCEALGKAVQEAYEVQSESEQVDRKIAACEIADAIETQTPENAGYLYLVAGVVEDWAAQTKADIVQKALQGEEVSGFEIRYRSGRSSITDTSKAIEVIKNFGVPVDKIVELSTVSLTAVETLTCSDLTGKEKSSRKKEVFSELVKSGALSTSEAAPYLYRATA